MKQATLPRNRMPLLTQRREFKMAESAHAYMRGSTIKFYEWLAAQKRGALPEGPPVWICGDCHASNLGPLSDAKGRVEIQIRDLDQTVIGNPAHDLIRLGLSLAMAARGSDLPGAATVKMIEHMVGGYSAALLRRDDRANALPKAIHFVINRAVRRSWKQLAEERIKDTRPTIPLGKTFWPLSQVERSKVDKLFDQERVRKLVTMLRSRPDDASVEVLDAAYWVKGCSSLGRLRLAVLLSVGAKAKNAKLCLMDVKEAVAAAAPRYPDASMPRNNAARVVEGARHLSPFLGQRMLADQLLDHAVVIRELRPQDLKLEFDSLAEDEAVSVGRYLAGVVGHAHARQLDAAARKDWQRDLGRNRSKSLDAPSWFWSSIVSLIANHEAAYLEHCRRFAEAA